MQRARGRQAYTAALRGLAGHDERTVANELREACRFLPELSREPVLVASRLSYLTDDPDQRLRQLTTAARIWPDRQSDTALFLTARAAAGAIRAGRLRSAAAMLRSWPLAPTPGFVYRILPASARMARAAAQRRLHRGRETAELDAR